MEYLPHIVTGVISAIVTGIGTASGMYVWFRKQMNVVDQGRVEVEKQQTAVDATRATLDAAKETAASEAWQKLFDRLSARCEAERVEANTKIDQLNAKIESMQQRISQLDRENAGQGAQIQLLQGQVARLEGQQVEAKK